MFYGVNALSGQLESFAIACSLLILWLLLALALLTQAWLQYSIQSTNYLI
jgi:hypothetical protein